MLPTSRTPLWDVPRRTRISEDDRRGLFAATFPPEMKTLDRRAVTLSGFKLPLDASQAWTLFLLSKYMPVCFFCPPRQLAQKVESAKAAAAYRLRLASS